MGRAPLKAGLKDCGGLPQYWQARMRWFWPAFFAAALLGQSLPHFSGFAGPFASKPGQPPS
jgi:formate hydrogenlyase subunit 3/multisubunit Na+/H+ antiporter MnhD subunit